MGSHFFDSLKKSKGMWFLIGRLGIVNGWVSSRILNSKNEKSKVLNTIENSISMPQVSSCMQSVDTSQLLRIEFLKIKIFGQKCVDQNGMFLTT